MVCKTEGLGDTTLKRFNDSDVYVKLWKHDLGNG